MAIPFIGIAAGMAQGALRDLTGPVISQTMSEFRMAGGWNDVARARAILYRQQLNSTRRQLSDNFTPIRLSVEQAVLAFNQGRWSAADGDREAQVRLWRRLQSNLRYAGVNIDISETIGGENAQEGPAGIAAREWARLFDMASHGPLLNQTIRDYYRSRWLDADLRSVSQEELDFQLRRASIRRQSDRHQVLNPFYHFDVADAYRLYWYGLVDRRGRDSIVEADGCIRHIDQEYLDHLSRRIPDIGVLIHWAEQGLWNEQRVAALHLDHGLDDCPIAKFFIRAQGLIPADIALPEEPAGQKDFMRLAFRSTRKAPAFGEALHLQYRLRPSADRPGESIIQGVPSWTGAETIAALIHGGVPEPIAKQMVAASTQPMEMDFIGETISQALEHPTVMRLKNQLFGPGYQWLTDALLDHGFDPKWARLGTEVVVQIARSKALAERYAKQKTIRQEARDIVLKSYAQGTVTRQEVVNLTRSRHYSERMALNECRNIDQKVRHDITETKIAAIKDAYLDGGLSQADLRARLERIIVNEQRVTDYIEAWQWERTTKAKRQSTAEILASMKAGLITPQGAIARLTNLGWTDPDALAEVALAQHEMMVSQAKQQAAMQARQAAAAQKAAHDAQAAADHARSNAVRAAKERHAIDRAKALANHKKLMAESTYYARVHNANASYKAAEKVQNQDKMQAEIAKSAAAYQRWLIDQLQLITHSQEVANVVGPLQTEPTPTTGQGEGTPQPSPDDQPPPDNAPGTDSGSDAEGDVGGTVPGESDQP